MKKKSKQKITKDYDQVQYQITKSEPVPHRVAILRKGARLTTGVRNAQYGNAYTNMKHFAGLMTAYFALRQSREGGGWTFSPEDAAMIMVLAKNSRIVVGNCFHEDNYIDGAVYLAMAGEACAKTKGITPCQD